MKKFILILVGIFLLISLLSTFVAPAIVRNYVCNHGEDILGRKIRINDLSANIFTGQIDLDGLIVFEQDGIMPFIQLHRAETNLSMLHLLLGVIDLETLQINRLDVNMQQRDTVFNFTDILQRFTTEEEFPEDGLPIVIRDIALSQSSIHYQDLLVHSNIQIRDINLHIPGIDLRDLVSNMGLDLEFVDGGHLTTQMNYNDRTRQYSIELLLSNFSLQGILPYVQQTLWAEDLTGVLNADLKMEGNLSHILDFHMSGRATAKDVYMEDHNGKPVFTCDSATTSIREINLLNNRISLSQLVANDPVLYITYDSDSLDNFSHMMQIAEQKTAEALAEINPDGTTGAPIAKELPDFNLYIGQLQLKDGSLFYRDEVPSKTFSYQISGINVNAPNFTLKGYNNIKGKARLGETGSITLEYHGKLDNQHNMHLDLHAADVEITDFSPYTLQMFGNGLDNGTLFANIQLNTNNGDLSGEVNFRADQIQVAKKKKGVKPEMSIPFRTAVNLLTDSNGKFQISVPVSGNIDEPKFSYKRVIFRLLGKMFIRVCTFGYRNKNLPADSLRLSTIYNDFDIDDINIEEFANDSIGEVLLKED